MMNARGDRPSTGVLVWMSYNKGSAAHGTFSKVAAFAWTNLSLSGMRLAAVDLNDDLT